MHFSLDKEQQLTMNKPHLGDNVTFPEVHSLEDVSGCYSISFCCLEELGDLFHLFESHLCFRNFLDGLLPPWIKTVDESTKDLGQRRS